MEASEQNNSKVVLIDSLQSWEFHVNQAYNQNTPVVVHFTASWCMPSVAMTPVFEELASSYPEVLFLTVDVDEVKEVATKMDVKAMPTFLLLKDGAAVDKVVGANPEEIKKRIDGVAESTRVSLAYIPFWPEMSNSNWVLDYDYLDNIPLTTLEPPNFSWSSSSPPPTLRFMELGSILDPRKPLKMDKAVILSDAVRVVSQLREEAQKLRESTENLQEKINALKDEKNELRDEKQRLKVEKENLEQKVKALSSQPSFLAAAGQVVGSKLVPFMGYPGVAMWQFLSPAAVDTSQDHVLRPPVA
ncbi:hypothetical protein JHK82_041541 [Glycine max]|nr:hypothetical protein JHK82_041541 [Glycine max]